MPLDLPEDILIKVVFKYQLISTLTNTLNSNFCFKIIVNGLKFQIHTQKFNDSITIASLMRLICVLYRFPILFDFKLDTQY